MAATIKTAGIEQVIGSVNESLNHKWRVFSIEAEGMLAKDAYFDADDDASDEELHGKGEAALGMSIPRDGLTITRPPIVGEPFDAMSPVTEW